MARKTYDCCGGVGRHLDGCDNAKPSLRKPRGPRRERGPGGDVPRPNTGGPRGETYGQPCPPHNPSAYKKGPRGSGTNWYKCSKCRRHLGKW